MKKQDYSNHRRHYVPHHFVLYPALLLLTLWSGSLAFRHPEQRKEWLAVTALFILTGCVSFMMRQHYALSNQDRIVRLELRLRYYQLTQERLEPKESKLEFAQLAALRFASDEELPALVDRAVLENLSPDDIKRAVKDWLPDTMRV